MTFNWSSSGNFFQKQLWFKFHTNIVPENIAKSIKKRHFFLINQNFRSRKKNLDQGGAVKKSPFTFYFVPVFMRKSKQRFMFIPSPATCFAHVSCQKIPCGSQKGFIEMTNIQETTPDWGDRWNSKLRMNEVDDFPTIWWQQYQQSQINSAIFFNNFVCWMSLSAASVEIFAFCST